MGLRYALGMIALSLRPLAAVAPLLFLLARPATVSAQGALTPPGAPAPGMVSLQQLDAKAERRTPITSAPFVISVPGSYYLVANLAVANGDTAIQIASAGVTLDLNGFDISSSSSPAAGDAISISGTFRNISIRNGSIRGAVSLAGSTFSGAGFLNGIVATGTARTVRVDHVSVSRCLGAGIDLGLTSNPNTVSHCAVSTVGGLGIRASIVSDCVVTECGGANAIAASSVSNSRGENVSTGRGVSAESATNSIGVAISNTGLVAFTASGCRGRSTSGNGLEGDQAINCSGESVSGLGITMTGTATFCRGARNGGIAISCGNAIGCTVDGSGTVDAVVKSLGTP